MAWMCRDTPVVEGNDPIIDVQKVIADWAWNHYIKRTNSFRKIFFKRKDFVVDVPMNYYLFEDTETEFSDVNTDKTLQVREVTARNEDNSDMESTNPNTSVLSTKYVNDTGKAQVYKFRMERTRKATVNVNCTKGFSINGSAKFSIGVADGNVSSKFEVTNIRGQSFEQTLLFETSSDIQVVEKTDCTAMVVFTERETRKRFKVNTKMSLSSGSAPIYIRRKKDNMLFALLKLTDLKNVFQSYEKKNVLEFVERRFEDENNDTYITNDVKIVTEGVIEGMRLSDQTVKLRALNIGRKGKAIGTLNEELTNHNAFHNQEEKKL